MYGSSFGWASFVEGLMKYGDVPSCGRKIPAYDVFIKLIADKPLWTFECDELLSYLEACKSVEYGYMEYHVAEEAKKRDLISEEEWGFMLLKWRNLSL
jgi:hypothetical protein